MAAEVILAGVSATFEAIETWLTWRDSRRAAQAFEARVSFATPALQQQAIQLNRLVPSEILDAMQERVQKCWSRYHNVLTGNFLPDEIDEATENVKACVCRELNRIVAINGSLPDGILLKYWEQYSCSSMTSKDRK